MSQLLTGTACQCSPDLLQVELSESPQKFHAGEFPTLVLSSGPGAAG